MLTSTSRNPLKISEQRPAHPAKLLAQREDYSTCHIHVSGESQPLPAIALEGRFYSFFRSLSDAQKTVNLLVKLSIKGNQTAVTPTRQGYALWVYESAAVVASSTESAAYPLPSSIGPADCWVIGDRQPGYRTCSLNVPDLPDVVPGLANGQKLFSLYRRESDADMALKLGARLSQRGDETVILSSSEGYALCIYEPGATIVS